jgi:hypothetical protein
MVFCTETDHFDNSSNVRYGGYYKPYYTLAGNRLELHGVPVPRSERFWLSEHRKLVRSYVVRLLARGYFAVASPASLRNDNPTAALMALLQRYVVSKGALLLVGLTALSPNLEDLLRGLKIPQIDLSTQLRYPGFGRHWTAAGHQEICDRIEKFLEQYGFMGPAFHQSFESPQK